MPSSAALSQGRYACCRALAPSTSAAAATTTIAALTPRKRCLRYLLLAVLFTALLQCPGVSAFNTCEEIQRCSECVFDQTDGLMPPPLICGWCESAQSCKEVNSTVLSFYRPESEYGDTDADGEVEHTPEEVAAYRAAFCPDLRERNFNPLCSDMSCVASHTTNNIYICRAPPIVTLVFACILFVLTCLLYVWMLTLQQLPWKYEPFVSDLLAGRFRQPDESDADETELRESSAHPRRLLRQVTPEQIAATRPSAVPVPADAIVQPQAGGSARLAMSPIAQRGAATPTTTSATHTTAAGGGGGALARQRGGSAVVVVVDPPPMSRSPHSARAASPEGVSSAAAVNGAPTTAAAAAAATAAAAAAAAVAATGCCPVCKCRHPVHLGPGDVCFWCNVARFTFVPFSFCLLSSAIVIVLTFAVSLKPWFSDWYFTEVTVVAYAVYAGLAWYVWGHHRRAPLFYFETEAERKANQRVWAATRHRARTSLSASQSASSFQVGVPGNNNNRIGGGGGGGGDASLTEMEMMNDSRQTSTQLARNPGDVRLQLLNDARRNMASTMYLRLALQLRGRSLLTQMPEIKRFHTQLESMHGSTATATAAGGANATSVRALNAPPSAATPLSAAAEEKSNTNAVPVISPFAGTAAATANDAFPHRPSPPTSATRRVSALSPGSPVDPSASSSTSFSLQHPRLHAPLTSNSATATAVSSLTAATQPLPAAQQQPQQQGPPATPPPLPAPASPAAATADMPLAVAPSLPEYVARQKRGETAQLLSSDFLSPQYRRALKSTLFREEFITWCAKPQLRGVLMDNEWLLLDLVAGLLFGVWMLMLSSVSDNAYAIVRLSGSTAVAACGLFVLVMFALLLLVVVRSCGRLYVLTNERLITVYESFIEPVVTATELSTVKFAALYGYRSIWSREPVLDFSWEIPAPERKMPVIKSHKFPGIVHLNEFLYYFRLVAPSMPFHLQRISESTKQDRIEWRLHVVLCLGLFIALPIITIYPHAVPDFLAAFLYCILTVLIFSTLLRGLRAQQMTCAPLNTAAVWAPEPEWVEMSNLDNLASPLGGVPGEGEGQLPLPPSSAAAPPLPLPSSFTLGSMNSPTHSAATTCTATPDGSSSSAASPAELPAHPHPGATPLQAAAAAAAAVPASTAAAAAALLSAASAATVVPAAPTAGKADSVVHPTVAAPIAAGVHVVSGQVPASGSAVNPTGGARTSPTSAGAPAPMPQYAAVAAPSGRSAAQLSGSRGSNNLMHTWISATLPPPQATSSASDGRRGPTPPTSASTSQRLPPPSSAVRAMEESLTGLGVFSLASSVGPHHSYASGVNNASVGSGAGSAAAPAAAPLAAASAAPVAATSRATTPARDVRRARRESLGPSAAGFLVFPAATAGSHGTHAGGAGGGSQRGQSPASIASSPANSPTTCASTPTAEGPHGYLQLPPVRTTTRGASAAAAPAARLASEGRSGSESPRSARSLASATRTPTDTPMDLRR